MQDDIIAAGRRHRHAGRRALALAAVPLLLSAGPVSGAKKIEIDDDSFVTLGGGLRTSISSTEDAAPSGDDRSTDFNVNNMRLYFGGQVNDFIGFTFNTETENLSTASTEDADVRVLDAFVKFQFDPAFNLWVGRTLVPSDRFNFDGPFFLASWTFPIVRNYPAEFAGRDNGVSVVGRSGSGFLKYNLGVYEGRSGATSSNQEDNPLFAGRLVLNFLDEEPGPYNASTYYGDRDVLALALGGMSQSDGAGTQANPADFNAFNVDLLWEQRVAGGGVPMVQAAYYSYDLGDAADLPAGSLSLIDGDAYLLQAGWLFPQKVGPGRLQPHVRYQDVSRDDGGADQERMELGVNYVIEGHNARVSAVAGEDEFSDTTDDSNFFILGFQVQI